MLILCCAAFAGSWLLPPHWDPVVLRRASVIRSTRLLYLLRRKR
jgi:hypothetical protein